MHLAATNGSGLTTRKQAHGQLLVCLGCCCGQTARGRPAVPVERLKAVWKAEKLGRTIQLTISGCLGPCDLANVVAILSGGATAWFGGLADDAAYDALIRWARACQRAGAVLPTPAELAAYRFERFVPVLTARGFAPASENHGG